MPKSALIYTVFIACPSDVISEKEIIQDVVLEWNKSHGPAKCCRVETTDYTDAFPEFNDRPQAIINKQVFDHSDIVVAMFWTRFGSSTGVADSGTEEEIIRAKATNKPLMLYFSDKATSLSKIDGKEYDKIEKFKLKHKDDGLYKIYQTDDGFRTVFRRDLASLMNILIDKNHVENRRDVQELHHINLAVSNLKESIDFYCDNLGLHLIKRAPFRFGGAWFGLPNGQHLHLVETPGIKRAPDILPIKDDPLTPPRPHFALRIENEHFRPYTNRATHNLKEDRWVDQPFSIEIKQLYILDPDKYLIEITNITEKDREPKYIERSEWEKYAYWWRDGIPYPR